MDLPAAGREYAHWTITSSEPDIDLQASVDGGLTWHLLERVDATTVRLLVAGPDAPTGPAEVVTLTRGRTVVRLRVVDQPEIVIRYAGVIDVT